MFVLWSMAFDQQGGMMTEQESIIEWISRVGLGRSVFYKLLFPIWNFTIDRLTSTLEGFAWVTDQLDI
jgi:hypothetical protein